MKKPKRIRKSHKARQLTFRSTKKNWEALMLSLTSSWEETVLVTQMNSFLLRKTKRKVSLNKSSKETKRLN